MFALAEALHAHGHVREAGRLARELAEEMLASGPDAGVDYSAVKGNHPPSVADSSFWIHLLMRCFGMQLIDVFCYPFQKNAPPNV